MTTWSPPTDTEIEVDKPLKAADIRRIRDLAAATAEGAVGAPRNAYTLIRADWLGGIASVTYYLDTTIYRSFEIELMALSTATNGRNFEAYPSADGGVTFPWGHVELMSNVFSSSIGHNTGRWKLYPAFGQGSFEGVYTRRTAGGAYQRLAPFGLLGGGTEFNAIHLRLDDFSNMTSGLIKLWGFKT